MELEQQVFNSWGLVNIKEELFQYISCTLPIHSIVHDQGVKCKVVSYFIFGYSIDASLLFNFAAKLNKHHQW